MHIRRRALVQITKSPPNALSFPRQPIRGEQRLHMHGFTASKTTFGRDQRRCALGLTRIHGKGSMHKSTIRADIEAVHLRKNTSAFFPVCAFSFGKKAPDRTRSQFCIYCQLWVHLHSFCLRLEISSPFPGKERKHRCARIHVNCAVDHCIWR